MEKCSRCGGSLEKGHTDAAVAPVYGAYGGAKTGLTFVVPGEPTSANPLKAFRQGLDGEADRVYWLEGYRCCSCGGVELYAKQPA
jgi:hypothetical protein